jgi:hypothetical protein
MHEEEEDTCMRRRRIHALVSTRVPNHMTKSSLVSDMPKSSLKGQLRVSTRVPKTKLTRTKSSLKGQLRVSTRVPKTKLTRTKSSLVSN